MVIGVSPDDAKQHRRFKKKFNLPYTLIADTDHAVSTAYGVWQQKSMFGRKYFGIIRTTFLIAPDGRIARVVSDVAPEGHATEVLAALNALRG